MERWNNFLLSSCRVLIIRHLLLVRIILFSCSMLTSSPSLGLGFYNLLRLSKSFTNLLRLSKSFNNLLRLSNSHRYGFGLYLRNRSLNTNSSFLCLFILLDLFQRIKHINSLLLVGVALALPRAARAAARSSRAVSSF